MCTSSSSTATPPDPRGPGAVKHATPAALAALADLLARVRAHAALAERRPGVFYKKSRAFLHFHEDPAGLFADLVTGAGFDRYPVNTPPECEALLSAIDRAIG